MKANIALQTSYDHFLNFESDEKIATTPLGPWFQQHNANDSPNQQKKSYIIKKQQTHKHMLTEPVKLQEQGKEYLIRKDFNLNKQSSLEKIIKLHFSTENQKLIKNQNQQVIKIKLCTKTNKPFQSPKQKQQRVASVSILKRKKQNDLQLDTMLKLYNLYKIPLLKNCNYNTQILQSLFQKQ